MWRAGLRSGLRLCANYEEKEIVENELVNVTVQLFPNTLARKVYLRCNSMSIKSNANDICCAAGFRRMRRWSLG
jgi:hypothetical protein